MFSVSVELSIQSPSQNVFEALTNQGLLTRWFAPQVIAVPVQGTIAAFAFEFDLNFKMELITLDKPKIVRWRCVDGYKEWLDSEVVFKLEQLNANTILRFEHGNLANEDKKEKTLVSWKEYLDKLKKLCEEAFI